MSQKATNNIPVNPLNISFINDQMQSVLAILQSQIVCTVVGVTIFFLSSIFFSWIPSFTFIQLKIHIGIVVGIIAGIGPLVLLQLSNAVNFLTNESVPPSITDHLKSGYLKALMITAPFTMAIIIAACFWILPGIVLFMMALPTFCVCLSRLSPSYAYSQGHAYISTLQSITMQSWAMIKQTWVFWLLVAVAFILTNVVGVICLLVGLLISVPLSVMILARSYLRYQTHMAGEENDMTAMGGAELEFTGAVEPIVIDIPAEDEDQFPQSESLDMDI